MVFNSLKFQQFIGAKDFLPDSFTSYKNKIGLSDGEHFISTNKSVVLDFPYKDCILEGGQTNDKIKRSEVFFYETLAPDEIDILLKPKLFTSYRRYTTDKVVEKGLDFEPKVEDNLNSPKKSKYFNSQETKYFGTPEFYPENINARLKPEGQTLNLAIEQGEKQVGIPQTNNTNQELNLDITTQSWYAHTENYGTDQEKYLVKCVAGYIAKLQTKYQQVYLLRNEKVFKIYNFEDGVAFQPDFILFLESRNGEQEFYQIFIEPKGEHLFENDKWKEDCLKSLQAKVKLETLLANKKYNILGMPFFNESKSKVQFMESLKVNIL